MEEGEKNCFGANSTGKKYELQPLAHRWKKIIYGNTRKVFIFSFICGHKEIAMAHEWKAEIKARLWVRSGCKCVILKICNETLVVTYYYKFETKGRLENVIKYKSLMLSDSGQMCKYQIAKLQNATKYTEIDEEII